MFRAGSQGWDLLRDIHGPERQVEDPVRAGASGLLQKQVKLTDPLQITHDRPHLTFSKHVTHRPSADYTWLFSPDISKQVSHRPSADYTWPALTFSKHVTHRPSADYTSPVSPDFFKTCDSPTLQITPNQPHLTFSKHVTQRSSADYTWSASPDYFKTYVTHRPSADYTSPASPDFFKTGDSPTLCRLHLTMQPHLTFSKHMWLTDPLQITPDQLYLTFSKQVTHRPSADYT